MMEKGLEILKLQNINLDYVKQDKKKGTEENVKIILVEPLLELLGYDKTKGDLDFEHIIRNKRADILIKIDDKPRMIVECKSLEEDLDKHVEQALGYAYNKQVGFVILTNGLKTRLYKSFIENVIEPKDRLLLEINLRKLSGEFKEFEKWVSKKSLVTNQVDQISREKEQNIRESVTEPNLVKNLQIAKIKLTVNAIPKIKVKFKTDISFKNQIEEWCYGSNLNIKNEEEWIEKLAKEIAYSFINKLYFYRIAEDRAIVKPKLTKEVLAKLKDSFSFTELIEAGFNEILKIDYRAIFEHSLFDKIKFDESVIKEIIIQLSDYNFKEITSDILGKVYEHHIGVKERKELGQFYTPKGIINYITNRIGIDTKKKYLDPACGSGGFLIDIYDKLKKKYLQRGLTDIEAHNKILENNVYGIDINPFAVQLTAMNLALKNLEGKTNKINIISHDSLIPSIHGWTNLKTNDIDNNHKEVIFDEVIPNQVDVVIGNPPYVRIKNIKKEKLKAYQTFLQTAKGIFDLFSLFVERGVVAIKNKGKLGFIISNTLLTNDGLEPIREYLLKKCRILEIVELGRGIFEEANVNTIILILQKEESEELRNKNKVLIITKLSEKGRPLEHHTKQQSSFWDNSYKRFITVKEIKKEQDIIEKIKENSVELNKFLEPSSGIQIWKTKRDKEKYPSYLTKTKENEKYRKIIEGKDIDRFSLCYRGLYVLYEPKLLERGREERFFTAKEKIVMRYIGKELIASLDLNQFYAQKSVICFIPRENNKFDLRYLLAVLNSNLMQFYYLKQMGKNIYPRINLSYVEQFPIKQISKDKEKEIVKLVDRILKEENKEQKNKLIRRLNDAMYDIYKISKNEKEVIEKS